MTKEDKEMKSSNGLRMYWAAGRGRSLPGDKNRAGLSDIVHDATIDYAKALLNSDTSFTLGWMEKTSIMLSSNYLGLINNAQVISDIVDAERDGFDVAMIGPNWDPGLREARGAVGIPVAGPGESAMMVARTLGAKFAYLTVEGYAHFTAHHIQENGFTSHAISQRPVREFLKLDALYESVVKCVLGQSDEFLTLLEKKAKECIADGADVIIAGGQFFGPALLKEKFVKIPNTSVPVVDSTACGLKFAELLGNLRRTTGLEKSQHETSPYRTPPKEIIDQVRKKFNF